MVAAVLTCAVLMTGLLVPLGSQLAVPCWAWWARCWCYFRKTWAAMRATHVTLGRTHILPGAVHWVIFTALAFLALLP